MIAVSSSGHAFCPGMNWDDLNLLENFSTAGAYCQAKLANVLFTRELTRRAAADGIVAQPGLPVASNLMDNAVHYEETSSRQRSVPDINCADREPRARAARGARAHARRARRDVQRQPLDALARRARREQPDGGRAGEDRDGARTYRSRRCSTTRAPPATPLSRRADRTPWRDPQSGYLRCNISPDELRLADPDRRGRSAGGARVAYENGARDARSSAGLGAGGTRRGHGRRASRIASPKTTASRCSSTSRPRFATARVNRRDTSWSSRAIATRQARR